MEIFGSRERLLDSVLPHEVLHTVFASHFGCPLPRWADEGACTTVEHHSERSKQEHNLIHYLKHDRGIAFNKMFAMREYPPDMLPLYAQGYSLTRYLIAKGGERRFVQFIGDGMALRSGSSKGARLSLRTPSLRRSNWPTAILARSPLRSAGCAAARAPPTT